METTQYEQSQAVAAQLPTAADNPQTATRYDRQELSRIVEYLTSRKIFNPEYILLFGSLTGGTQHSEASCYDLLAAVQNIPADGDWLEAKSGLRRILPYKHRTITYINIYLCRLNDIQTGVMPYQYFAHKEGELVYCKERYRFNRPKRVCNFAAIYRDAATYFDTFMPLGELLIKAASAGSPRSSTEIRWSAYMSAQAAKIFYKVLYFVFHNEEFYCDDLVIMHDRMRTLSTDLMLLFDSNTLERKNTLASLRKFESKALHDQSFSVNPNNLSNYMADVASMKTIVEKCCRLRLELYKSSIES